MSTAASNNEYHLIALARSDGMGYASLDHDPLDPSNEKDLDQLERWEVIIGGHLQNQIGPKNDSKCGGLSNVAGVHPC